MAAKDGRPELGRLFKLLTTTAWWWFDGSWISPA